MTVKIMDSSEFKKERPLWRRTGQQDAANALDPSEIREELGSHPNKSEIVAWLIGGLGPKDFEGALEFPEDTSQEQQRELLEIWADGWAEYASAYMKDDFEERVEDRVFHEPREGLLPHGWWVTMYNRRNRGPFDTKEEALAMSAEVEENDEDIPGAPARPGWD